MQAVSTRTVATAIALTLLVCVVAIAGREPLRGATEGSAGTQRAPERVAEAPKPLRGQLPPEVFIFHSDEEPAVPAWLLRWTIIGLAVAAVVAACLLLFRGLRLPGGRRLGRRRARRTAPGPEAADPSIAATEDDAEVARRAVEAALKPLHDPADPRSAVIAAYARMEEVLAERELGRRTPEAPREYLARVLCGGGPVDGLDPERFFAPTVLADVAGGARILAEETFGPVAPLLPFDGEADAIRLANATDAGLAAYLFTRDLGRAHRVGEALDYGMVAVNDGALGWVQAPFGGIKGSGDGREGGRQGLEEYLDLQYLSVNFA